MEQTIVTLIQNAAMLLSMMVVFDLFSGRISEQHPWKRQALAGVMLGILCIGLMLTSFQFQSGLIFDTRAVLLSLTGLFLGTIPTLLAVAIAAAYRFWEGGMGLWPGISSIIVSGSLGLLWRHYRQRHLVDITSAEFYAFGFLVHLVVLAVMLMLPWDVALGVISGIGLPFLLINPIATIVLGHLLRNRLQREHTSAVLAAKEIRYRSAFESANVGKSLTLLTGEMDVNKAFCDMLGYRPEEIQGKTWQELVPAEDIGLINDLLAPLVSGEKQEVRFEKRYLHKNGSFVWTDFSSTLERDQDSNPLYFIVTVVDITGIKRSEELSRISDARFQAALELTPDGFTILQPVRNESSQAIDFIWKYENAAVARINGTDPEKVIGKQLLHLFPDHRGTPVFDAYVSVANTGETRIFEEVSVDNILARPMWLRLVVVSMGTDIAILTQDITLRKQMEGALELQAKRADALLRLPKLKADCDERSFMQQGLELLEMLTSSKISYVHFINGSDEVELVAWSRNTLEHNCSAGDDPHNHANNAALCLNVALEGGPIVFNDYTGHPREGDLPAGVSAMQRFISVPVIERGRIVMSACVGNKDRDYTNFDVESVQLFATAIWQIVKETRSTERAREAVERIEMLAAHVPGVLYQFQMRPDGSTFVPYASKGIERIFGVRADQVVEDASAVFAVIHRDDIEKVNESIQEAARTHSLWNSIYRVGLPDGSYIWVEAEASPKALPDKSILWHGYARDVTERKNSISAVILANEKLSVSERKLHETINNVIHLLSATVEVRDPYTAGHQHDVAVLSSAIAVEMGLSENIVQGVGLAAEIHDLGKLAVPAEILSKPSRLNDIEFALIKMHPQTGFDILKGIEFPWPIAEIVLQHHERIDGSGYPRGLKGDDILMEAKILGVADVVEAMSSHRPYRAGLGLDRALAEIEKSSGKIYDPAVVDACLRLFREKGFTFAK